MKFSEIRNEDAIDALADIIEPASIILTDEKVKKAIKDNKTKMQVIKIVLKEHKSEVLEILAALDGVPVDEYSCNILTLPAKLLEIFNDKDVVSLFISQGQMMEEKSSGSAMENTKAKGK